MNRHPFVLKPICQGVLICLALLASCRGLGHGSDPRSLRAEITRAFPGGSWVDTSTLGAWLQDEARRTAGPRPVVLDARTAVEFAVSHLPGALRVDPGSSVEVLRNLRLPAGAPVVVYCSVGWRSAAIAERLATLNVAAYNLEGGIFSWANEGRPLVRGNTPVRRVHNFSRYWGRFLKPELAAP